MQIKKVMNYFLAMSLLLTIFLGTAQATNNTWVSQGSVLSRDVISLAYDPAQQRVFAGTKDAGVWTKTLGETNWRALGPETGDQSLVGFHTDIQALFYDGSRLYAGVVGSDDRGVWSIPLSGEGWRREGEGSITAMDVYSVLKIGRTIYAGTGNGVFLKTDGDRTWSPLGRNELGSEIVRSLVNDRTHLYATSGRGVWSAPVEGGNWTPVGMNAPGMTCSLLKTANHLYVGTFGEGVWEKADSSDTWLRVGADSGFNTADDICGLALHSERLIAGTGNRGVFSQSGTSSWARMTPNSLDNDRIFSLLSTGSLIIAGTQRGIFVKTDPSIAWFHMGERNSFPDIPINDIYHDAEYTLIATNYGVFRKNATSGVWERFGQRSDYLNLTANKISRGEDGYFYIASVDGVYRKSGGETHWTLLGDRLDRVYSFYFDGADQLYVGHYRGVSTRLLSSPATTAWQRVGRAEDNSRPVYSLAKNGSTLYAGTTYQVYAKDLSTEAPWSQLGDLGVLSHTHALLFSEGILYAGTNNGIWLMNIGRGSSRWESNTLTGNIVYSIVKDSARDAFLAATSVSGIVRWVDYSRQDSFNEGLSTRSMRSLFVSPRYPHLIFSGSYLRGGVFSYQTSICGNGVVEPTDSGAMEFCDDGNVTEGDACNATCTADPSGAPAGEPGVPEEGSEKYQEKINPDSFKKTLE